MDNGTYRARAVAGGLGETSTGKEQVGVDFQLLDPAFEGQHITWFGYFTDKTQESTIRTLRTCGWNGDDLTDLSGIDANDVHLVIENEEYEGKWRPRVRWVNPVGGLALRSAMEPNKARAFAAKMRGAIAAVDQASGERRAPAKVSANTKSRVGGVIPPEPPPYASSPEADDIPF